MLSERTVDYLYRGVGFATPAMKFAKAIIFFMMMRSNISVVPNNTSAPAANQTRCLVCNSENILSILGREKVHARHSRSTQVQQFANSIHAVQTTLNIYSAEQSIMPTFSQPICRRCEGRLKFGRKAEVSYSAERTHSSLSLFTRTDECGGYGPALLRHTAHSDDEATLLVPLSCCVRGVVECRLRYHGQFRRSHLC